MEKLSINVAEGNDITIREGDAAKLVEPCSYQIGGDIRTVANWLTTKLDDTDITKALLVINMKNGRMKLNLNIDQENGRLKSNVEGSFTTHPDLASFRINTGFGWDVTELGNHCKFHRRYFMEREANMNIVAGLKSFYATVLRQVEKMQDDRGDHRRLDAKKVTTNLPEVFTLAIPLFVGQPPTSVDVEMVIEEKEGITRVKLQSVDLIEKTEAAIEKAISAELDRISGLDKLTIIYE